MLKKVSTKGLRVAAVLALALAAAHCGDSDVRVSTGPGVVPAPGTFTGNLSDGGTIRLEVGSIEEVAFDCDGEEIQETFDPPRDIDNDGTFNVKFSDGGRDFRVRGTFRDNNTVDGTIDDEDNECDVSYDATRGGVINPTPVRTPTSGGPTSTPGQNATSTPGGGATSTAGGGATSTPGGGATFTPGGGVVTPTSGGGTPVPTSTASGNSCPVAVEVVGNGGSQKVLDSGWTGLAHNATVVSDGKLTFTLSGCDSTTRPCGTCDVGGPIQNLKPDQGDINPHRCANDTSKKCTQASDCTGSTCEFFFGAPLPLSAGGISTCVVNQVSGTVSGTANVESGAFQTSLNLISKVFNQISVDQPCPKCDNDSTANDGTTGTCNGGARNGQACDVNGKSPVTAFGSTSLDCPPSGQPLTSLQIALSGSSGTETKTLAANSPGCSAAAGKKCFCPFTAGQPTQPNACLDDTLTQAVEGCGAISGSTTKGECKGGPIDPICSPIETFRSCGSNADCTQPGDTCVPSNRPCYLDNGAVGGSVTAIGMADPPVNGTSNPTFASLFCVGNVAQPAVNAAAGLPGLGRVQLPLISKEILTLPSQ